MARDNEVTMNKGREYVSLKEFADRMNVGINTVRRRVSAGLLDTTKFDGRKTMYIDWETGASIWYSLPFDKGRSKSAKKANQKRFGKVPGEMGTPDVKEPEVADVSVEDNLPMNVLDLDSLSKEKYSDCLLPNGQFDYDVLEKRIRSETLEQKLKIQRGQLVAKSEVVTWAKRIGIQVSSGLESIPSKFASVLMAQAQSIIAFRLGISDFEFTEEERTKILSHLKGCAPEIMKTIKQMVDEWEEE